MNSLLIDLLIFFLLAAVLIYAVVLTRRISRLQSVLIELAPALQAFCDAVDQSERSVAEIRRQTDRMEESSARSTANQSQPRLTVSPRPPKPGRADLVRMFFETAKGKSQG